MRDSNTLELIWLASSYGDCEELHVSPAIMRAFREAQYRGAFGVTGKSGEYYSTFMRLPLFVDRTLPDGVAEVRDHAGRVVERIEGLE